MRKSIALLLGILLPLLGLSGIGHAQSSVQVQGTIQSVDCQSGAMVLVDAASGASNTIVAGPYTSVLVGSSTIPFCALEQYVGAPAAVSLVANGNELVAARIDILGPAATTPAPPVVVQQPYPVPEPVPAEIVSPLPIVGIVLGTIAFAGLVYLLTRDHDGRYYRYPYYGAYYHHYYRPEYRPYFGLIPAVAPIITVPPRIVGPVLGTTTLGGFEYLVARDRDGRFYRYPYYGPYRQHYYRADYRPYAGPYRDAPLREGDPHWSGPALQNVRPQGPRVDPPRAPVPQNNWRPQWNNNVPGPQTAPRWTPPAVRNDPAPQNNGRPQWNNNAPGPQNTPRWTPPAVRNDPAPQNNWRPQWNNNAPAPQNTPRWTPSSGQNDRRAPAYSPRNQQSCTGRGQSCDGPDKR